MNMRWVVVPALGAAMGLPGIALPAPAQTPKTWTVIGGGVSHQGAVFANAFFPRVLDIHAGGTVRWQFEGFHNVAFSGGQRFPPLVLEEGGKSYLNPQVAFPQGPETYEGTGYRNSGVPPEDPSQ